MIRVYYFQPKCLPALICLLCQRQRYYIHEREDSVSKITVVSTFLLPFLLHLPTVFHYSI